MGNGSSTKSCFIRASKKNIVLLLLGLEGAGKTTVAKGLARELENGVVPTVGFSSITLAYKKFQVILYDLGGGPGIRGIWENYFSDAHGIIYVLDSADTTKLEECRDILRRILLNDKLSGKPLLVLGNKQDIEGALDEIDIVEMLDLENLVNQQKCPTLLETCSAITLDKSHPKEDPAIQDSFKWLLRLIERDFDQLNSRVECDMKLQKESDQAEQNAKLQRISENHLKDLIEENDNERRNGRNEENVSTNLMTTRGGGSVNANSICDNEETEKHLGTHNRINMLSSIRRRMFDMICTQHRSSSVMKLNKSSNESCLSSNGRKCCWRRNKRTAPLNEDSSNEEEREGPVWAIRLPSVPEEEAKKSTVLPAHLNVPLQSENSIELEEFTGVRHPSRPQPSQVMKG